MCWEVMFRRLRRMAYSSSITRISKISSMSLQVNSLTKVPRLGTLTTSPSDTSRCSASRTGLRLTPSWLHSSTSCSQLPGGYCPSQIFLRRME